VQTAANENYELTPLAAYGALIYKSQSCNVCHTQKIENEVYGFLSLDGVGGKYRDSWLYHYIYEPRRLLPSSNKLSYRELDSRPLNKERFAKAGRSDSWNELIREAEELRRKLKEDHIETGNTEILALITYIQQIPSTPRKLRLDSIERQKILAESKRWDEMLADSANVIMMVANDDSNIPKGQFIYQSNCSPCHAADGGGGVGPNLTDDHWIHGGSRADITRIIVEGVPQRGMISYKNMLTPREIGEVVAYTYSLRGTTPANPKAPQGTKE
jgi:mono/diheme cytochrome c family protein